MRASETPRALVSEVGVTAARNVHSRNVLKSELTFIFGIFGLPAPLKELALFSVAELFLEEFIIVWDLMPSSLFIESA